MVAAIRNTPKVMPLADASKIARLANGTMLTQANKPNFSNPRPGPMEFNTYNALGTAAAFYDGGVIVAASACVGIALVSAGVGCAAAAPFLGLIPWVAAAGGFFLGGFHPEKNYLVEGIPSDLMNRLE